MNEAKELYNDVLSEYEKTLGVSHPDTLLAVNNLGLSYHNLGDYEKAEISIEEVLKVMKLLLVKIIKLH